MAYSFQFTKENINFMISLTLHIPATTKAKIGLFIILSTSILIFLDPSNIMTMRDIKDRSHFSDNIIVSQLKHKKSSLQKEPYDQ